MAKRHRWTVDEDEAALSIYFEMLEAERNGEIRKEPYLEAARAALPARTGRAIELRWANTT